MRRTYGSQASRAAASCCVWIAVGMAALCNSLPATGNGAMHRHAASAAAAAARGSLRIEGSASKAVVWRKVYAQIPGAWKAERTVVVRELTGAQLDRLVGEEAGGNPSSRDDDSVVDGYYQNDGEGGSPVVISLRSSLRGEQLQLVFAHEYAHYVWDDLMTSSDRRAYASVWRQQKRDHRLVTGYAEESPDEGFAEAASYLVVEPQTLERRDPRSAEFLRSLGRE